MSAPVAAGSPPASGPADLLIVDGRVFQAYGPRDLAPYGSDIGPRPVAAPNAVAIRGGKIAWVGRMDEGRRDWEGPGTRVVEARGGLITAGFDDAHIHVLAGAAEADHVNLFQLPTVDAIQGAIAAHAAANPSDPWVQGQGWMYVPFPGGLPTRDLLDAVVPHRPASWAATTGTRAGSTAPRSAPPASTDDTPDPWDGEIVRDRRTGEATGVLKEGAQEIVTRVIPKPTRDDLLAATRRSIAAMHRMGITAIQDADVSTDEVALWRALRDDGSLRLRTRLALQMRPDRSLEDWGRTLDEYEALVGDLRGGEWLDAGILKASPTASSRRGRHRCSRRTSTTTRPVAPSGQPDQLDAFVAEAHRRGWQVEIHAIGDAGIRMALDAFERLGSGRARERRHRVEHVEAIDRADIRRFGELGVVASMQPYHADPSPNQIDLWAGNIGPDRASQAWSWQSIRRDGGVIALGSDWPVVPFDPFLALNSACNRQTLEGQPPAAGCRARSCRSPMRWLPTASDRRMRRSRRAAAGRSRRGWTRISSCWTAISSRRGPSSIMGTKVALTVVGGEIVHASEDVA